MVEEAHQAEGLQSRPAALAVRAAARLEGQEAVEDQLRRLVVVVEEEGLGRVEGLRSPADQAAVAGLRAALQSLEEEAAAVRAFQEDRAAAEGLRAAQAAAEGLRAAQAAVRVLEAVEAAGRPEEEVHQIHRAADRAAAASLEEAQGLPAGPAMAAALLEDRAAAPALEAAAPAAAVQVDRLRAPPMTSLPLSDSSNKNRHCRRAS